jgi:phospholipid transport system substrate-binding protein
MVSRRSFAFGFGAVVLSAPRSAVAQKVEAGSAADAARVVKTLVQNVRQDKDEQALRLFDLEEQGRFVCGEAWTKASPAGREEFMTLFGRILARIAFPKVRENFKNLSSITYEPPDILGDLGSVRSTIFLDHPLKKQELKLRYTLAKRKAGWRFFDLDVLGSSMLEGIRDDQVKPLLEAGGWDGLMKAMRNKDAELAKSASKPR